MSSGFMSLGTYSIYSEWLNDAGELQLFDALDLNFEQSDGAKCTEQICRQLEQFESQLEELQLFRDRAQTYFPLNLHHQQFGISTTNVESAQILKVSDTGNEPQWNLASPDWGFLGWIQFVSRGKSGKLRKIQFDQSYFEAEFPADGCAIWLFDGIVVDVWLNEAPAPRQFQANPISFRFEYAP